LLYTGREGFLTGTLPFIREGLDAGEPVLVAAPGERLAWIEAELGPDTARILLLDMARIGRNPARIISEWRAFLAQHGDGDLPVRGVGEPAWAERSDEELLECARHEALLNLAFRDAPRFRLLCPYDVASLDRRAVRRACATHPIIWENGAPRESASYLDPLGALARFDGELAPPPADAWRVGFGPHDVGMIRRLISGGARGMGIPSERANDLVLAVSEIASNSILHGGGRGDLLVWRRGPRLVCEIRDRGRIGDPLVGRSRPSPEQLGGRGVWLANEVCDLVQLRTGAGGTVVRLSLGSR